MKPDAHRQAQNAGSRPPPPSTVLIVDDHPMLRRGLAELINHESDLITCGEADDAGSAMRSLDAGRPDLIVMDISLKDCNGLELIPQMLARDPTLQILVCSMHDESLCAERSLRAGARGFVNKEQATSDVILAIRTVLCGSLYLSERTAQRLLRRAPRSIALADGSRNSSLTSRELDAFGSIGFGRAEEWLGAHLGIDAVAVKALCGSLPDKLGLSTLCEVRQCAVSWILDAVQRPRPSA